jgi:uncharacterized protein
LISLFEVVFCAVSDQLVQVPGVPFPFTPSSEKLWRVDEATGAVLVSAGPHTDIFIDPGDGDAGENANLNAESMLNAATLLGDAPDGDFQLSARVTVDFASTFDVGVFLLCWTNGTGPNCALNSRPQASP